MSYPRRFLGLSNRTWGMVAIIAIASFLVALLLSGCGKATPGNFKTTIQGHPSVDPLEGPMRYIGSVDASNVVREMWRFPVFVSRITIDGAPYYVVQVATDRGWQVSMCPVVPPQPAVPPIPTIVPQPH